MNLDNNNNNKNEMTGIVVVMSEVIYCTNLVFILPVTTVY